MASRYPGIMPKPQMTPPAPGTPAVAPVVTKLPLNPGMGGPIRGQQVPQPMPGLADNPASRDAAIRNLATAATPTPVAAAPVPTGVPGVPGAVPPNPATAPPAASPTPSVQDQIQTWLAARPDQAAFHQAMQNATTPQEREAAAQQHATEMKSWADQLRDGMLAAKQNRNAQRSEGTQGPDGGGFDSHWDDMQNQDDQQPNPAPDSMQNEDSAAQADAQRIKRMRKSRLGGGA